ncbi:unnamed protein product [Leuciscus chuanchicus]
MTSYEFSLHHLTLAPGSRSIPAMKPDTATTTRKITTEEPLQPYQLIGLEENRGLCCLMRLYQTEADTHLCWTQSWHEGTINGEDDEPSGDETRACIIDCIQEVKVRNGVIMDLEWQVGFILSSVAWCAAREKCHVHSSRRSHTVLIKDEGLHGLHVTTKEVIATLQVEALNASSFPPWRQAVVDAE